MLGEYIGRILTETQNRPSYTIRSVEVYKEKDAWEKPAVCSDETKNA
jgi:hypothetical protein